MKKCLLCLRECGDENPTCPSCGEATWAEATKPDGFRGRSADVIIADEVDDISPAEIEKALSREPAKKSSKKSRRKRGSAD